jgi:hypothetical protein
MTRTDRYYEQCKKHCFAANHPDLYTQVDWSNYMHLDILPYDAVEDALQAV